MEKAFLRRFGAFGNGTASLHLHGWERTESSAAQLDLVVRTPSNGVRIGVCDGGDGEGIDAAAGDELDTPECMREIT